MHMQRPVLHGCRRLDRAILQGWPGCLVDRLLGWQGCWVGLVVGLDWLFGWIGWNCDEFQSGHFGGQHDT